MSVMKSSRCLGRLLLAKRDFCSPSSALACSKPPKTQLMTYSQLAVQHLPRDFHPFLFDAKPAQKITCRTATWADEDEIVEFVCRTFLTREPLMKVLNANVTDTKPFVEYHVKEALKNNASFVAVDETGKLCGIRLNAVGLPNEGEAKMNFGSKMNTLAKFLEHVEGGLPKRLGTSRIMRHIAICVNPDIARSGVGTRMMEKSVQYAKDHGLRYMVATCSGKVATKLALKMGFRVVKQVPYDSYTDIGHSDSHFAYFPDDCLVSPNLHRPFLGAASEHFSAKLMLKNIS